MDELFDLFLAYIPTTSLIAPHLRFWPNGGGAIVAYTNKAQDTEQVVAEWTSVQRGIETIRGLSNDPSAVLSIEQRAAPSISMYKHQVAGEYIRASEPVYYEENEVAASASKYMKFYGSNPVREVTWLDIDGRTIVENDKFAKAMSAILDRVSDKGSE